MHACMICVPFVAHVNVCMSVCLCVCRATGPFGERDNEQVFVQRVVPETDKLFVRLSSNGQRYLVTLLFML